MFLLAVKIPAVVLTRRLAPAVCSDLPRTGQR
jgi:hypothetical protein